MFVDGFAEDSMVAALCEMVQHLSFLPSSCGDLLLALLGVCEVPGVGGLVCVTAVWRLTVTIMRSGSQPPLSCISSKRKGLVCVPTILSVCEEGAASSYPEVTESVLL